VNHVGKAGDFRRRGNGRRQLLAETIRAAREDFCFAAEAVEESKADMSIEVGEADGLKREKLAGLEFELFDSLAAGIRRRYCSGDR